MVNLPNALTLLRIFLVPVLVVVLLTRTRGRACSWARRIFGLAVLTDYLDGYFARRRNQVTRLGILLDPLADKLLTAAAFLSLVEMDAVPAWMVMIILGREFAVTGLRNVARGRGLLIPASRAGQGEDGVAGRGDLPAAAGPALSASCSRRRCVALWVVVVLALVSGVDYFRRFWRETSGRGPSPGDGRRPEREGPAGARPRGGAVEPRATAARPGRRS